MKFKTVFIVIIVICMNLLISGIDKFYSQRGSVFLKTKDDSESVISSSSKDVSESSLVVPTPKRSPSLSLLNNVSSDSISISDSW